MKRKDVLFVFRLLYFNVDVVRRCSSISFAIRSPVNLRQLKEFVLLIFLLFFLSLLPSFLCIQNGTKCTSRSRRRMPRLLGVGAFEPTETERLEIIFHNPYICVRCALFTLSLSFVSSSKIKKREQTKDDRVSFIFLLLRESN